MSMDYFKEVPLDVLHNLRDKYDNTLLSKAACWNKLDCCREIHRRCPSLIWHQSRYSFTALHRALNYGASIEFVEFLITAMKEEGGEDLERGQKWLAIPDIEGDTALHHAVKQGNIKATRILMEADSDHEALRIGGMDNNSPLNLAVEHQNFELVKILTVPQPDFAYYANDKSETPVLMAMRKALSRDSTSAVIIRELLLERQPNQCKVSTEDKGWTTLHHAACKGDLDAIEDIIKFCPDCMTMHDNEGQNFLHIAAKFGHVELVKYVLETKEISASILNGKDQHGYTPLYLVAEGGNKDMVCYFLYDSRMTNCTEVVDNEGRNFLHIAAKFGHVELVKYVLGIKDISASILNGQDHQGFTPLHYSKYSFKEFDTKHEMII